ncbi:MAG TPA: hypothetical protein DCL43_14750, partial [Chitinophagaceae bacterium]|nr:hypothetical protein [Chitinophagaceae bacterium]
DTNVAERFLTLPKNAGSEILRIAERLRVLNTRNGFLSMIGKKDGMPVWDRAINTTKKAITSTIKARGSSINDTIIFIPLVLENTQYVNAFILAKLNDSIQLNLYRSSDYVNHEFGTLQDTSNSAEKFALQFMLLDFETFGYSNFKVIDNRLFSNGNSSSIKQKKVHIDHNNSITNARGSIKILDYEVCTTTKTLNCSSNAACCASEGVEPGTCSACEGVCWSSNTICIKQTILVIVDDWGGGGIIPTTTGGGGGGGGSSTEPQQPCNPTPSLDNGLVPCLTGKEKGWIAEPIEIFPKNPCTVIDSLLKKSFFTPLYKSMRDSVTRNYEMGMFFKNPFEGRIDFGITRGPQDSLSIEYTIPAVTVDGFVHNHYNHPNRYSVFSGSDLYTLYHYFKSGKISDTKIFTFGLVTDSTSYILMINDTTAFRRFGEKYLEENPDLFDGLILTYDITSSKPAVENEIQFLKILKQFTNQSVSIFKGNSDFTEFKRIEYSYDSNTIKHFPCN